MSVWHDTIPANINVDFVLARIGPVAHQELAEPFVQKGVQKTEVDLQVAVNQHVSETGDITKFTCKTLIEHTEASELVDGTVVVRYVATPTGSDVGRNVERVLGTELETAFHNPQQFRVGVELLEGNTLTSGEDLERLSQRGQVPADDLVPLPLGPEPPVGSTIHVLGHPAGQLYTFTTGIVSRFASHAVRVPDDAADGDEPSTESGSRFRLMTITAAFGRGASGAPVLDTCGAVVGVARQTKSIHHHADDDTPPRLQMVLKQCAPSAALVELGLRPAGVG